MWRYRPIILFLARWFVVDIARRFNCQGIVTFIVRFRVRFLIGVGFGRFPYILRARRFRRIRGFRLLMLVRLKLGFR